MRQDALRLFLMALGALLLSLNCLRLLNENRDLLALEKQQKDQIARLIHQVSEAEHDVQMTALTCGVGGYAAARNGMPMDQFFATITNAFGITNAAVQVQTN